MTKREAKRRACRIVAQLIDGYLYTGEEPEGHEKITEALRAIEAEMWRRSPDRT